MKRTITEVLGGILLAVLLVGRYWSELRGNGEPPFALIFVVAFILYGHRLPGIMRSLFHP